MSTIPSTAHAVPSTRRINLRLTVLIAVIAAVAIVAVVVVVALSSGAKTTGNAATQSPAPSMHYYGTGAAPTTRPYINLSAAAPTRASQPQQHFYGLNP